MIAGGRGAGQKLLNKYMGMQFPFRVMKMLWNWPRGTGNASL